MNLAATLALMAAALATYVAGLAVLFARAPGWRDQGWFALAALAIAGYAILDVPFTVDAAPRELVVAASRAQLFLVGVHQLAWLRYSELDLGLAPRRRARVMTLVPLIAGAAALLPGVAYGGAVAAHAWPRLGLTYRDPVVSRAGDLLFAVQAASAVVLIVRYGRAWRRGAGHALGHAAALLLMLAAGLNDALVEAGAVETPYLLVLGLVVPIAAVGHSVTRRFAADARAHVALELQLEALVEERSRELARAQDALHQAEKLAAVGQLAAGVAHEVNNPAAAVMANLRYLGACKASQGAFPDDAEDCLAESVLGLERISNIVRRLRDAARPSRPPAGGGKPVALAAVVERALARARPACPARVTLAGEVAADVRALGDEEALSQALVPLLVNGAQAIPAARDGHVLVRAERAPGRVRLVVQDDGEGMTDAVLRRALEPFFSTRRVGAGKGLGLTVARGLVHGAGGELRLESTPGQGTRAIVELPADPADPVGAAAPA